MKRFRLKSLLAVVVICLTAIGASAYWLSAPGAGSGSGQITTLTPPLVTLGTPDNGSLPISWSAAEVVGDEDDTDEFTYTVQRKVQNGPDFASITEGPCADVDDALSCIDELPETANYIYRVVAHYRSWTATSEETEAIAVEVNNDDVVAPTVFSIKRPTGAAERTNLGSVLWEVKFTEDVSGVDAGDFTLDPTVTGAGTIAVSPTPGDASKYTVSASTGTGDGTLGLDLIDNDSIKDPGNNQLGGDGNGNFLNGETYTIDKTAPVVQSITRPVVAGVPVGEFTNDDEVSWTVKFSEDVSLVDPTDFEVHDPDALGAAVGTVTPVSGDTYTVTAASGAGDGTIRLDLDDDGSIKDGATNQLGGSGPDNGDFTNGDTYTLDRTGPSVQSITSLDPSPTNAATVRWEVQFDDNNVQGVNQVDNFEDDFDLVVVSGSLPTAAIATVVAKAGGEYWVTANTGTGDGQLRLDVNDDGTITDQAENPLGGPGADDGDFTGGSAIYTIDKTIPTVSITRDGASPTAAPSVTWTVSFSEVVSGVTSDDFELAVGAGLTGSTSVTNVTTTDSKDYTVTASTGTGGEGTLNLNVDDDDTVEDAAHNKLGGPGLNGGDFNAPALAAYTIDHKAPQLTTLEMRDNDVDGFVDRVVATFDQPLEASTDNSLWVLANTPGGATKGALNVTQGATTATLLINEDGSGKNTAVGSFTVKLDAGSGGIKDALGNQASFDPQAPSDKAAPVVASITRVNASPTTTTSLPFTVLFSESVTGVTQDDFSAFRVGTLTSASVNASIGGGPASYTVTVTASEAGTGNVRLDLSDNDSIQDLASPANKLSGTGTTGTPANGNGSFTTGESYFVDRTGPVLQTLEMSDADADGRVDRVTATFNEALNTSYSAPNSVWTLTNAPGGAAANVIAASGGVTISNSPTPGTVTLTLEEGSINTSAGIWPAATPTVLSPFTIALAGDANGIRDALGNESSFAATNVADKANPTPTSLTFTRSATTGVTANVPSANDVFAVLFSEPLAVASICSTWVGNTTDQSLAANNQVTMTIKNNAAPGTGNDQLIVNSIVSSACAAAANFGTLDLGSSGYVDGDVNSGPDNGATGRVELKWTFLTRELRFKLGTTGAATQITATVNSIYTPDSDLRDLASSPLAPVGIASDNANDHW